MDRYTVPDFTAAALLTIDVQRDVLDGGPLAFASPSHLLPAMARVVTAFRRLGAPIVHVVRLYRPDGSDADLCRRTRIEGGRGALLVGTGGDELAHELLPDPAITLDAETLLAGNLQAFGPNEAAMYKPRWGAFYRTPLHQHLAALGVTTVVVIGCNYPNCPRTTIYQASERDFRVVAVTDAISRFDQRARDELTDIAVATLSAEHVIARLRAADRPPVTGSTTPERQPHGHR